MHNAEQQESASRPIWKSTAPIPAGHFLVYYVQPRDHIRCDPEGKLLNGTNEAGRLFLTLDQAQQYAQQLACTGAKVGTGIYDSHWQVLANYMPPDILSKQKQAQAPQQTLLWAMAFLIAGGAFLWLEARSQWTLMFGFLIGARLLLAGVIRLVRGLSGLRHSGLER